MIHWRRLLDLPLLVILMGIACVAMLMPAGHALALRQLPVARAFFYSGLILVILTAMIAVATANHRPRTTGLSHLATVIGAYLVLPVLAAVPVHQAVPGLSFVDAWFEMISCFTTTGASVLDVAGDSLLPVHFWRAFVGWSGGFFILLSIAAVLAPLGLGGAELMVREADARGSLYTRIADPSQRLARMAALFFPPYVAVTACLWVGLLIAGDPALIALSHAMGAVSTSGISAADGLQGAASGVVTPASQWLA